MSRAADVLVTGSAGRVGQVLMAGLGRRARPYDLPDDVLDAAALGKALAPCSQVVHLAWRMETENYDNGGKDPQNLQLVSAVLDAARASGIERVILASSVHAGSLSRGRRRRLTCDDPPRPTTPYGASKVSLERLGREAAGTGLDVVSIRFGGLCPTPGPEPEERGLWLSPDDCVAAVDAVLATDPVPGRSATFYAVSRTRWQQHSTANDFGWRPARRRRRR